MTIAPKQIPSILKNDKSKIVSVKLGDYPTFVRTCKIGEVGDGVDTGLIMNRRHR